MMNLRILLLVLIQLSPVGLMAEQPAHFDYMLRGYCYAGNETSDPDALGGYGRSSNVPKILDATAKPAVAGLYLEILPARKIVFAQKYQGIACRLVNGGKETKAIPAADSRLSMVQEAKDVDGQWKEIEYLPRSRCGNSYHRVYLKPREFWLFAAPRYSGPQQTTLRFKLALSEVVTLYSEEYEGGIHPQQFSLKKEQAP